MAFRCEPEIFIVNDLSGRETIVQFDEVQVFGPEFSSFIRLLCRELRACVEVMHDEISL